MFYIHLARVYREGNLPRDGIYWGLSMPDLGVPGPLGLLLPFLLTSHSHITSQRLWGAELRMVTHLITHYRRTGWTLRPQALEVGLS